MFLFWYEGVSLTKYDIIIIALISLLITIITILLSSLFKRKKVVYIDFINTCNLFYSKGKLGYSEKHKEFDDKTKYVECHFILNFYNDISKPIIWRDINIVSLKHHKMNKLEEGCLNINGTEKSIAGVSTYDKLKNIIIKPYEGKDYDVNIRLSREEYLNIKHIYLSYRGNKNKIYYIKIRLQKNA